MLVTGNIEGIPVTTSQKRVYNIHFQSFVHQILRPSETYSTCLYIYTPIVLECGISNTHNSFVNVQQTQQAAMLSMPGDVFNFKRIYATKNT